MSDVLKLPEVVLANPRPPEEWDHRVCCDERLALCGFRFTGADGDWPDTPRVDEHCCPVCLAKERVFDRCAAPGCPGWWIS